MVRTFAHETAVRLAEASSIPVINGLSDLTHPCQALADYLTIQEVRGGLEGVRLAYVGDGNNVAHSLICGAALLGVRLTLAAPRGYEPRADVLAWAREHAAGSVGALPAHGQCRGRRARRRRRLHRHLDQHGPGRGRRGPTDGVRGLRGDDARCCGTRGRTRCSCTACPRIAARRSRRT